MTKRIGRFFACLVGCLASAVLSPADAVAEKRVALVVGNSAYQHVTRLANPLNDARLMAQTLQTLGFTLIGGGAQTELDKAGFDDVVQRFGRELQGADVGLFFYAGHGVQVRGSNYLIPVTANPTREADVDFQMVDVALVLRQMEGAGTKLNLVLLDACRNNPFGGRGLRTASSGLAHMQAPEGTLISYATQPGSVAQDGVGANSPYSKALAETMRKSGLDIFQAFNQVGLAVKRATANQQQPWVSSSPIDGNFYFAGGLKQQGEAGAPAAVADPCASAEAHWRSVEAIGSAAALEDHLTRFPNCAFAGLARVRLQAERSKAAANKKTAALAPDPAPGAPGSDAQNTLVLETSKGPVVIRLRADIAPRHAERLKQLARDGFYNNAPFHRVIAGFMAQTGDGEKGNGTGKSKYPNLAPEFSKEPFRRGIVAMARAADPNSANSQFFIAYAESPHLNGQYTVVGEVVSGMDNVDKIKKGEPVTDPDRILRAFVQSEGKK